VESPHHFDAYIGEIRLRLESQHPRLCRLYHIVIAILLIADDAALPVDNVEGLQLSMNIFEQFCNDHKFVHCNPKDLHRGLITTKG